MIDLTTEKGDSGNKTWGGCWSCGCVHWERGTYCSLVRVVKDGFAGEQVDSRWTLLTRKEQEGHVIARQLPRSRSEPGPQWGELWRLGELVHCSVPTTPALPPLIWISQAQPPNLPGFHVSHFLPLPSHLTVLCVGWGTFVGEWIILVSINYSDNLKTIILVHGGFWKSQSLTYWTYIHH